jgi:glucose/arabinose dehydrogenase
VVELAGRIRVLGADGTLAAEPFLDVRRETATGAEQGLLGLAFAADYATSGEFFVHMTAREPDGQIQVRRYRVSAVDPNRADPASRAIVLRQDKPGRPHHNGGGLRIGPDGRLWVALGDGGVPYDTDGNARDLRTLLGKIVRIERDGAPAPDNPFVGSADGARPEIWQYGLRNPFRMSFDRATGDLYIGDVGESRREEVDRAPAAQGHLPGADWGWSCLEGTLAARECEAPGAVAPFFELDHDTTRSRSITGGIVVRDPGLPTLAGRYLYGDLGYDRLHSLPLAEPRDRAERTLRLRSVVSLDEDGCGRPVVTSIAGRVARIVDGALSTCARAQSGGGPAPEADTPPVPAATGCGLRLSAPRAVPRRSALRRGLRVTVAVRTPCRLRLALRAAPAVTLRLLPGARRAVRLRPETIGRRMTVRVAATQGRRTVRRARTIAVRRG